jgi:hypothetical protein
MERNDDPQLRKLLREWQVPDAPLSLNARLLGRRRSWWHFLLTGQIPVPVPLGLAVMAALVVMGVFLVRGYQRPPAEAVRPVFNLTDFQPVEDVHIRVIRSNYANQ